MTGGVVAVLGPVGFNFGAGMTGGEVFVYDPGNCFADCANGDTILDFDLDAAAEARVKALIERHHQETNSPRAAEILGSWETARRVFRHVRAKEAVRQQELEAAAKEAPTRDSCRRKAFASV